MSWLCSYLIKKCLYDIMWSVELKRVSRVYAAMKSLHICVFCVGVEEQGGIKESVAADVN